MEGIVKSLKRVHAESAESAEVAKEDFIGE